MIFKIIFIMFALLLTGAKYLSTDPTAGEPIFELGTYTRTGPVKANVCHFGFICSLNHTIVAVKGDDGMLYEISESFKEVSEFRDNHCFIKVDSNSLGLISKIIDFFKNPNFYEKNKYGGLEKISPTYLTFPCIKN